MRFFTVLPSGTARNSIVTAPTVPAGGSIHTSPGKASSCVCLPAEHLAPPTGL